MRIVLTGLQFTGVGGLETVSATPAWYLANLGLASFRGWRVERNVRCYANE
jgi:hypothetical protein